MVRADVLVVLSGRAIKEMGLERQDEEEEDGVRIRRIYPLPQRGLPAGSKVHKTSIAFWETG